MDRHDLSRPNIFLWEVVGVGVSENLGRFQVTRGPGSHFEWPVAVVQVGSFSLIVCGWCSEGKGLSAL